MLRAGIVGLPNVGKSTLFNALTRTRKAEMANYPFCTIEPNVGIVEVPDSRLEPLAKLVHTQQLVPAVIELVDIAGLVKGAYKGEGLGNQFLANIREVDAIVQVVRCFEDSDILHNMGNVDPLRDIEVINTELLLADLQSVETQLERTQKRAKAGNKDDLALVALLQRVQEHLNGSQPAYTLTLGEEEVQRFKTLGLLTGKPVLYACNVAEKDLSNPTANAYVQRVQEWARQHTGCECCFISAKLEAELADLPKAEADDFLKSLGVKDSGVSQLIRATYHLLGLASFFTAGEKEVRAWTFKQGMKAPECAGVIHTDFQKGFIKAEVISYEDFVKYNGHVGARKEGKMRLEGKEYLFQDGDVTIFKFNV